MSEFKVRVLDAEEEKSVQELEEQLLEEHEEKMSAEQEKQASSGYRAKRGRRSFIY
jgi:hypothetical protein